MAFLPTGLPLWVPMLAMGLVGIGTGAFMNIIVAVAQSAAPREDTGSVTATVSLVRQIGSTAATAVVGGLIGAGVAAGCRRRLDAATLTPQAVARASAAVQAQVAELYSSVHGADLHRARGRLRRRHRRRHCCFRTDASPTEHRSPGQRAAEAATA